jgi:hypothetical protein
MTPPLTSWSAAHWKVEVLFSFHSQRERVLPTRGDKVPSPRRKKIVNHSCEKAVPSSAEAQLLFLAHFFMRASCLAATAGHTRCLKSSEENKERAAEKLAWRADCLACSSCGWISVDGTTRIRRQDLHGKRKVWACDNKLN